MKILNRLPCLLLLGLTGCSGYANQFACKPQDGLGCRSITEVNQLVDKGWPNPIVLQPAKKKSKSWFSKTLEKNNSNGVCENQNAALSKTVRIWIAPYSDGNGAYWDEQWIYKPVAGHAVNSDALEKRYE